ncbi:MAG: cryptochrome/photolyase family protein [Planctomycetota bacterium]
MLAGLVYPHQLFSKHPALAGVELCVLIEEPLMFSQFAFHAQKLVLHRASLQAYAESLRKSGNKVRYVAVEELSDTGAIAELLKQEGVKRFRFVETSDDWLQTRLESGLERAKLGFEVLRDPHFFCTPEQFAEHLSGRKRKLFFTDFYVEQRKRLGILLDKNQKPIGGKWSFDPENRKKLPKGTKVPKVWQPKAGREVLEAREYVAKEFPNALGTCDGFTYPVTPAQARKGLEDFLEHRFAQFGDYEDAIEHGEPFLFHSVLTPALNIGLISPQEVVAAALERADDVPLNSLEGFIRQVIGWREYIRGVYHVYGRKQRSGNSWAHRKKLPASFYDGTTGIEPIDTVIRSVLKHGYCHHIERLMILGNFMMLCEIEPDEVYRWFMELFVDAYDWVMVPNVYGMSQHADGGLMTTKPYISGSAYVLKMSNFKRGPWCEIWDALYWRFIDRHRGFFASNPRMSVMAKQCERMGEKLDRHKALADRFLTGFVGGR